MAAILIFSVANGLFRNTTPSLPSLQKFMLVSPNARFYSNIDLICPATRSQVRVITLPGEVRRLNSAGEIVHAQSKNLDKVVNYFQCAKTAIGEKGNINVFISF